jgi:hypothetical protein
MTLSGGEWICSLVCARFAEGNAHAQAVKSFGTPNLSGKEAALTSLDESVSPSLPRAGLAGAASP